MSHFFLPSANASSITLIIGCISKYSGRLSKSRYLTPSTRRARGGTMSLGMSTLRESTASSVFASSFWRAIWPLRERSQLIKTFAALG